MSYATAPDYLAVITQLPPGTFFHADNVSWEVYDQMMEALSDAKTLRVYYDQGRLDAVKPTLKDEKALKIISALLGALSDALELDIESYGSTTLRSQMKAKGAEPDDSYYVQHAALVIGKTDLDLKQDPPPDIVVESDFTSSSLDRFAIYAALGVPEIWRVTNWHVSFWQLKDGEYQEVTHSLAFPFLPAAQFNEFLLTGFNAGERLAAQALRDWMKHQ